MDAMENTPLPAAADAAINLSDDARRYFLKLIDGQGGGVAGIRMRAMNPGTANADCQLEFCDTDDLSGDELSLDCDGFTMFIEAASIEALTDAEIDYSESRSGGQLTIRAPRLKPQAPTDEAPLEQRLQWLLDTEINPQLASHGGRVALVGIDDGVAILRFGGGCHGCGMVDVTLKNGIEKTLREKLPEITGVRDATDHDSGEKPYYAR